MAVLSPSETRSIREGKITDYCAAGVTECRVVSTDTQTVEVLRLMSSGPERAALYGTGQAAVSPAFPDLTLARNDIFRIEE